MKSYKKLGASRFAFFFADAFYHLKLYNGNLLTMEIRYGAYCIDKMLYKFVNIAYSGKVRWVFPAKLDGNWWKKYNRHFFQSWKPFKETCMKKSSAYFNFMIVDIRIHSICKCQNFQASIFLICNARWHLEWLKREIKRSALKRKNPEILFVIDCLILLLKGNDFFLD